jgi:glyoxylase-like metal-dependent hydrolase (beta-lactamase superfamily II)
MATIPLEDFACDVVGKTQRGVGLSDADLAAKAGVTEADLAEAKSEDGKPSDEVLLKLATALDLHGPSLVTMAADGWQPGPVSVDGLAQVNTTYHDMTVNAYLVWDAATGEAAAFDTGADAGPLLDLVQQHGLTLKMIFITHTHGDHIVDLDKLVTGGGSPQVFSHAKESVPGTTTFDLADNPTWKVGALSVEARSTWGHAKAGITYVVTGLAKPLAIVGDALFASSMGGGMVSFEDALATNRKEIFTLSDETVVCPGHGPLTTVGEEKAHNPFYPEFK